MNELERSKSLLKLRRIEKILEARESFWEFQKIISPDDFFDERTYLLLLALALQSFYENQPITYLADHPISHHERVDFSDSTIDYFFQDKGNKTLITVDVSDTDILIIEVPRRHHKSHTLINFETWILGKNPKNILATAAHNADLANEFSQYVRDGIEQVRLRAIDIIYEDIFPATMTKYGDRSKKRWALEGSYLSYTGAGIMTPIVGKGASFGFFDDVLKGPKEAFNQTHLEKLWTSYSTGWLPCLEKPRKQVFVMTPWVEDDPGARIQKEAKESGEVVKVFNCKAYTDEQGMLCEDILDKRSYDILKARMHPVIFEGNFNSRRIPMIGRLYTSFQTYKPEDLPSKFHEIYAYIDTADEGKDYLAAGVMGVLNTKDEFGIKLKKGYMLGVYVSQQGMEITEEATAKFLVDHHIQSHMKVMVESNAGGRAFARNVKKILRERYKEKSRGIQIEWFHQSDNKNARINAESHTVMKYLYMPANWSELWPVYHDMMTRYMKDGENEFDDCQDMTTGLAERLNQELTMLEALKMKKL